MRHPLNGRTGLLNGGFCLAVGDYFCSPHKSRGAVGGSVISAQALHIREADLDDLEAIRAIYNHEVLHGTATFDTEEKSLSDRQEWFTRLQARYPVLVACENAEVVGWGALMPWSDRKAYDGTAENSVYVREDAQGRGIGRMLLEALLREGRERKIRAVIAKIADGNPASLALHERCGFFRVGTLREVGFKFGRHIDVHLLQASL